jgi:hypothetical protein
MLEEQGQRRPGQHGHERGQRHGNPDQHPEGLVYQPLEPVRVVAGDGLRERWQ